MIKAVLLDLDNTLLRNPQQAFTAEYLRLLDEFFYSRHFQQQVSRVILNAVRTLIAQKPIKLSNTDFMLTRLAGALDTPITELRTLFDEFYRFVYPTLRRCTEQIPSVAALYEYLVREDYMVAIATNPLYPAEAIRQRLEWAGLPGDLTAYEFVSHSDNMHFIKPQPEYYAEVVARVGIEPDEAVMVGDDVVNDMIPAGQLGIRTFQVFDGRSNKWSTRADAAGHLRDFHKSAAQYGWLDIPLPYRLNPAMIETELRGNLGALYGLISEVQPHYWDQHPDPAEWSIMQIVCHLLESEINVQRPRLETILQTDNPFLVSPRAPAGPEAENCAADGYAVVEEFETERQKTIAFLQQIPTEAWNRPARHSVFGNTTFLEMAYFTAQHDRLHVNQLCQTLGNCS